MTKVLFVLPIFILGILGKIQFVADGVQKEIYRHGSGVYPTVGDVITVHCTGSLRDSGKVFWSTEDPGQQPFSFQIGLGKVIQGLDDGCLTMQKGEFARLIIASEKGYGTTGFPFWGIPQNATLIFDIEMLAINGKEI